MKGILQPFYDQYYAMLQTACETKPFSIATMGPQGTSSVQSLQYLLGNMRAFHHNMKTQIHLFDTFDEVLKNIQVRNVDFALVPSAYERITEFFWNGYLENCFNFLYPTPRYGLAAKTSYQLNPGGHAVISTCPAVAHLVQEFCEAELKTVSVEVVLMPSTTKALEAVVLGTADIAITNESSMAVYSSEPVRFFSSLRRANILWCVFSVKNMKERK